MLYSADPRTWDPGTKDPNEYGRVTLITPLEDRLVQWNRLYILRNMSKSIFPWQYLALLCSYLLISPLIASCLALGLHSCILLEVLGVKGHMHFLNKFCT